MKAKLVNESVDKYISPEPLNEGKKRLSNIEDLPPEVFEEIISSISKIQTKSNIKSLMSAFGDIFDIKDPAYANGWKILKERLQAAPKVEEPGETSNSKSWEGKFVIATKEYKSRYAGGKSEDRRYVRKALKRDKWLKQYNTKEEAMKAINRFDRKDQLDSNDMKSRSNAESRGESGYDTRRGYRSF